MLLRNVTNGVTERAEIFSNQGDGIWLETASNIRITKSTIYGNRDYGILLDSSYGVTIDWNSITDNGKGIALSFLGTSYRNWIRFNKIERNRLHGIYLHFGSFENVLYNNHVVSNGVGIALSSSYANIIQSNRVQGHTTWHGILLSASKYNEIYHSNLIDNKFNGWDNGENRWDSGACGNYWSDYRERYPDVAPMAGAACPMGVFDTPYDVPGGGNTDRYPLVAESYIIKL